MARAPEIRCVGRSVFVSSHQPGTMVVAGSYYTRARGVQLMGVHSVVSRSDTVDVSFIRFSEDNGWTWSEPQTAPTREDRPEGTLRRHPRGGYADPATDRFITLWTEGVLPTDDPLEGLMQWALHYTVSLDGGRTTVVSEPTIQDGAEFTPEHPLPGVWRGRNCAMMGDQTCRPITLADGTILIPIQTTPTGPEGKYHSPGGGFTYTDAAVLRGRWRADNHIAWELSQRVEGAPARSTRGMIEPTLAVLDDGRILMVMRGSNGGPADPEGRLPSRRWVSFSSDDGRTWTVPEPWTYADGERFFSPSSCSQLLEHSSGALLWLGNISPVNPRANSPRYPFVMGELDRSSGRLIRETVAVIDDRQPGESEKMTLSNFVAREDRKAGDVLLHMSRMFTHGTTDWTADALVYRIAMDR